MYIYGPLCAKTVYTICLGVKNQHSVLIALSCLHHLRPSVDAEVLGFSTKIIHHDSPLSPFYNHSTTPGELARNAALNYIARSTRFSSCKSVENNEIESTVIPNGGSYIMAISVGSPPTEFFAVADTGSDLVWLQCQPCVNCYHQDQQPFDPRKSSTYMELSCSTKVCNDLPKSRCGTKNNECVYEYHYEDHSRTNGVLASDTFTFDSSNGQPISFSNSVFGCGQDNNGIFNRKDSGIVGLGGGPLSLISQLGDQIGQKFAYCLLPRTTRSLSILKFGADAVLSTSGVVSTPILSSESDTVYYLTLEGASVGNKRISNDKTIKTVGNIVIDSGTTFTMFEPSFYSNLEALVKEAIGLNPVPYPNGTYSLCYQKDSFSNAPQAPIVFHFTGADVRLNMVNAFVLHDTMTCFAMLPVDGLNIFGNVAQVNLQVAYDLAAKKVSFAPADCSQF